jgi:undecaprenyl-diphosphatase
MLALFLLAVLQGITEMLPVSSSGHLALAKRLTQLHTPAGWLEAVLHFGTLLAIIAFYRKPIFALLLGLVKVDKPSWLYAAKILTGSLPISIVGLLFKDGIQATFDHPMFVSGCLIFTGVIVGSVYFSRDAREGDISWIQAIAIGFAQIVAILPGVSRSGTTISMARHLGCSPKQAAEFSFMISLAPLAGATLLSMLDAAEGGAGGLQWGPLVLATCISGLTGYVALAVLVKSLSSKWFPWFGLYCLLLGSILLLII